MRFAFDPDQLAFAEALRDLLAKECPPEVVRAAWDAEPGALDRRPWEAVAGMGVASVLAPEASGGLGLDVRSLVLLLEEAGYAALPHPVVETAAVAAPLLSAGDGEGPGTALVSTDLGGSLVACAADCDRLLLRDGDALRLLDAGDVALDPATTVDRSRRGARVTAWDRSAGTVVADGGDAVEAARRRGTLGTAAQLVGLARRMLDLTVAHVTDREQFGAPVGSFQAVKHHLAGVAEELAFARPVVHRAAWSVAVDDPAVDRDVSMAKAMASDAADLAGRAALQCHGAIGYTVEHDLHLFMKRAWALSRAWGDAAWHRARVAESIGA